MAPTYASCVENGQSLADACEEGEPRSDLEGNIADLQDKWERLDKLFGDLNAKLTAALVQVGVVTILNGNISCAHSSTSSGGCGDNT